MQQAKKGWKNFMVKMTYTSASLCMQLTVCDHLTVCVCVCVCVHVYVVYEDTNLYNDMGMT